MTTPQGDPGAVLEALLRSDGGSNSGQFSNAQLDALLDQGRLTFDQADRKAIYDEVQQIIADEAALIVTHDLGYAVAHADQIAVLKAGKIEEVADAQTFAVIPRSAYCRTLRDAAVAPVSLGAVA